MKINEVKKKKRTPKVTYTTGCIGLNIKHFNQMMGTDFGDEDKKHEGEEAADNANSEISGGGDNAAEGGVSTGAESGDLGGGESAGEGASMGESLNEAKRQVRRYYIRPQNIFCANKADVIKALIDVGNENCSVYTLKYLGDEKDVTKLTNKDIIYYYDAGVLSDKNHVKVMDYDLYIKHEEERKKFPGDIEDAPEAAVKDEYSDRLIDATVDVDESFNPFKLDFESINAFGEKLTEGKTNVCCICGEEFVGYGNNPEPYKHDGKCCDACNLKFVIPARLADNYEDEGTEENIEDTEEE